MKLFKKRYSPPGTPPGMLITEETFKEKISITIISYSSDEYGELEVESLEECVQYLERRDVTWLKRAGEKVSRCAGEQELEGDLNPSQFRSK